MNIVEYVHHGRMVKVRADLKGKHRDYCLCFKCKKFISEDREKNCVIANALYSNCVKFGVVNPVFECPGFELKDGG